MSKTALTKQIELDLFGYTKSGNAGIYGAYEVTFGAAYGDERVDYVTLKSNGEISCYEIKVSKFDFHSKAKLSFYGDYNYFVMPEELYEEVKSEIMRKLGVTRMSDEAFADYAGIHVNTLKRALKGQNCGVNTLVKICDALDIKLTFE